MNVLLRVHSRHGCAGRPRTASCARQWVVGASLKSSERADCPPDLFHRGRRNLHCAWIHQEDLENAARRSCDCCPAPKGDERMKKKPKWYRGSSLDDF